MNKSVTNISLLAIGLLQAYTIFVLSPQHRKEIDAQTSAAANNGSTTFKLFGKEVTMLGGIRSDKGNGCSVLLANLNDGHLVESTTGTLLDAVADTPDRVELSDCSKLPPRIFLAYGNS